MVPGLRAISRNCKPLVSCRHKLNGPVELTCGHGYKACPRRKTSFGAECTAHKRRYDLDLVRLDVQFVSEPIFHSNHELARLIKGEFIAVPDASRGKEL